MSDTPQVPTVLEAEPPIEQVGPASTGRSRGVSSPVSYRSDLQGLRAIAVVLVVAFHADVLQGGFVGVDVFFVVSGYVITAMIHRESSSSGTLSLGRFYLRRIRRLLPALGLMMTVTSIAGVFLLPVDAQVVAARTAIAAALLNANHYLVKVGGGGGYFGFDAEANPYLHTWSLSVEEQFYLAFPALFVLLWQIARGRFDSRRVLVTALSAVAVASFLLGVWLTFSPVRLPFLGEVSGYYPAPARAWEFLAGSVLALVVQARKMRGGHLASGITLGGLLLIMWSAVTFEGGTAFPGFAALVPVVGTLGVLWGGSFPESGRVDRSLSVSPLRRLGDVSYSWYLWHWPLIVFADVVWPNASWVKPVAGVASLVPASLSYRFVENPIRFAEHARARRTVLLGVGCVAAPVGAAVLLVGMNRVIERGDAAPFAEHVDIAAGCEGIIPKIGDESPCRWSTPGSTSTAVLIGDSNAGQYSEGFIAAAHALALDAVIATKSSCLISDAMVWKDGVEAGCSHFSDETMKYLLTTRPQHVVIAASPLYLYSASYELSFGKVGRTNDEEMKAEAYAAGLASYMGQLTTAGIAVTVIHPIPILGVDWYPVKMPWIRLMQSERSLDRVTDRAVALRTRQAMLESQRIAADEAGGRVVDFFDLLCPGERCRAFDGIRWTYRDGVHLSSAQALSLAPEFRSLLQG